MLSEALAVDFVVVVGGVVVVVTCLLLLVTSYLVVINKCTVILILCCCRGWDNKYCVCAPVLLLQSYYFLSSATHVV